MAGGSTEPDGDDDRQCIHCGLWFANQGLHKHEENCRLQTYDRRLVDLVDRFAITRADDVTLEDVRDHVQEKSGDGGPEDGPEVEASPTSTPSPTESPPTARTDGGPQAVPSDWGDATSTDEDGTCCPACGSEKHFDPSELPEDVLEEAPELAEYDRACGPCSKTDDGHLADTVEVYNV